MRKEYEMTEAQYQAMLTKTGPVMLIGGVDTGQMVQESANTKWQRLGDELGFLWDTAQPSRRGQRFFTAEEKPSTEGVQDDGFE